MVKYGIVTYGPIDFEFHLWIQSFTWRCVAMITYISIFEEFDLGIVRRRSAEMIVLTFGIFGIL